MLTRPLRGKELMIISAHIVVRFAVSGMLGMRRKSLRRDAKACAFPIPRLALLRESRRRGNQFDSQQEFEEVLNERRSLDTTRLS